MIHLHTIIFYRVLSHSNLTIYIFFFKPNKFILPRYFLFLPNQFSPFIHLPHLSPIRLPVHSQFYFLTGQTISVPSNLCKSNYLSTNLLLLHSQSGLSFTRRLPPLFQLFSRVLTRLNYSRSPCPHNDIYFSRPYKF